MGVFYLCADSTYFDPTTNSCQSTCPPGYQKLGKQCETKCVSGDSSKNCGAQSINFYEDNSADACKNGLSIKSSVSGKP